MTQPRPPSRRRRWRRLLALAAAAALLVAAYLVRDRIIRTVAPAATRVAWFGVVQTVAGTGAPGRRDGPAAEARFSDPFGIVIDRQGAMFVSDAGANDRLRRITPGGQVTTFAGGRPGFVDGTGAVARFRTPSGLAIDAEGRLYVADTGNHAIRRVSPDGLVITLAGDGRPGDRDGPARAARFRGPMGVAVDAAGNVFVADTYNDRIRRIGADGTVTTVAGGRGPGFLDGFGARARFDTPTDVVVAPRGDLLVADAGNDAIRRISPDRRVTTYGSPAIGHDRFPMLYRPVGLAVTADRFLYATDRRGHVVQLSPDGAIRTLAGAGVGFADGEAFDARFNNPTGIAIAADGGLRVTDAANHLVRRIVAWPVEPAGATRGALEVPPAAEALRGAAVPRLTRETLGVDALPWPLDPQDEWQELTGTMGEARAGAGGDGRARFHAGIDVRGDYGAIVRSVRDEVVTEAISAQGFGSTAEQLSIGLLTYVHMRVGRDHRDRPLDGSPFTLLYDDRGRPHRARALRGTRVRPGTPLGTINRAYHTHLELGPRGAEVNPLAISMVGLTDHVAPTIRSGGIRLFDAAGRRLSARRRGRLLLSGRVRIVVDAYDRVDGNLARRRLGLYRLGYQVLRPDGTPAPGFEQPRITMEFDRLASGSEPPQLAYAEGSGITVYGNPITRFRYIVTNAVKGGAAAPGSWDTTALAAGDYILRIVAEDYAGNVAMARRDVDVTIESVGLATEESPEPRRPTPTDRPR